MSAQTHVKKLVLLPGMDGTGTLFAPFIEALPKSFGALPVSYPAGRPLGYEELREDVREQLPELEPFALLAESFSTPLAVQIAAENPAGMKALILVAGFVTNPSYRWTARIPQAFLTPRHRLRLSGFLIKLLLGPDAPRELIDAVQRAVQSVEPTVLGVRVNAIVNSDARAELARVRVPILYLQAIQDRVVPPRCLDEIVAIKPDVTVAKIDGPHLLLQREPRQSANIITNFMHQLGRL